MSHTPGPWEYRTDSTCSGAWFVILPVDGDIDLNEISRTEIFAINYKADTDPYTIEERPDLFKRDNDSDTVESNARLIAGAPELLEALEKLVVKSAYYAATGKGWQDFRDSIASARSAVAKAKGESK